MTLEQGLLSAHGGDVMVSHTGAYDGTSGYIQANAVLGLQHGGHGGFSLPNGALLLAGQLFSETGEALPVVVANPSLRVFLNRDANVGFTPANSSDWATAPPTNIQDAINRIAAAVVTLQGGPIA